MFEMEPHYVTWLSNVVAVRWFMSVDCDVVHCNVPMKAEQDEASCVSLCILLDTFHHYPEKPAVLHCIHLFVKDY
jgi:hypothetical protein